MNHEHWRDYPEKEIYKVIKEKCKKCRYCTTSSGDNGNTISLTCSYIVEMGHRRPDRPEDCPGYKREKKLRPKSPRMVYGRELYEKVSNCSKSPKL